MLDAGCGEAAFYDAPNVFGPSTRIVLGDVSVAALRHAAAYSHDVVAMDFEALPFADGSFDRVICSLSLGFAEDPALALGEFARVLRHGQGHLVVAELSRQRSPSLRFAAELLWEELAREGVRERLRRPVPPLRRLAPAARLVVTHGVEDFFCIDIVSAAECWAWLSATHVTALGRLSVPGVRNLEARVRDRAEVELARGQLRSEQGVVFTTLAHA